MGADEEGTLARLKALRAALIDPAIATHHGRIVKTTGDGLLVEFASVVDAMRCAIAWQDAMRQRDAGGIEWRIGVNLGDVIIDGGDISATASTSPRASKGWPSRAASASRARF